MNSHQTTLTAPAGTSSKRGRGLRKGLLALLLAVVSTVGLGVSQASAFTASASGAYGGVTPRTAVGIDVYYTNPGALYGSMVPAINVVGPMATRSNGSTGVQRIEYRFTLWQSVNGFWIRAYDGATQAIDVAPGSYAEFQNDKVRVTRGYYRLTFSVTWKDQYLRQLGVRQFDYAHAGDYACWPNSSCQVGPGWILR